MNSFLLFLLIGGFFLSILSNNNVSALPSPMRKRQNQVTGNAAAGTWQTYTTPSGVNAMHMFVSGVNTLVFVDKIQGNPLKLPDGSAAISAEYNLDTDTIRALTLTSNTFCSAGSWLGNGTLLHTGGDGGKGNIGDGQESLRFYDPAAGTWAEKLGYMPSKRWYPTMLPLVNGDVLIMGGSVGGTGKNTAALNNPTYNRYPPKNGAQIPDPDVQFPFLATTLPYNLYVFMHVVPNQQNQSVLFIFANQQGILYNLDTATQLATYPKIDIPRTYPLTASSVMLPLRPEDNYRPEVMICGGQATFTPESPSAASCGRLDLSVANPAWEMDTFGDIPRVMPDSVILANGQLIFINGAQKGYAGFHKGAPPNILWQNSDPAFNPVLYDPITKVYTTMNPSTIARMYHSVATLVPDGYVFVAGSNPQPGVQTNILFPTEYRMEQFKPPYLLTDTPRPSIISLNGITVNQYRIPVTYGETLIFVVSLPAGSQTPTFTASLIHLGFVTHSQNMGQRFVGLSISAVNYDSNNSDQYIITLTMPPNPTIIVPGPHYVYILNNGAPCVRAAAVLLN